MLEAKNNLTEIQSALMVIHRPNTAEEGISELQEITMEIFKTEKQREKQTDKIDRMS